MTALKLSSFTCATDSLLRAVVRLKRLESSDFDTGTVNQATKTMASTDCHAVMSIALAIE